MKKIQLTVTILIYCWINESNLIGQNTSTLDSVINILNGQRCQSLLAIGEIHRLKSIVKTKIQTIQAILKNRKIDIIMIEEGYSSVKLMKGLEDEVECSIECEY